jgi:CDP-diacylglycerol pyrophosphatase
MQSASADVSVMPNQRRQALWAALALVLLSSACASVSDDVNRRQGLAGPAGTRFYDAGVQKCVDVHRASGGSNTATCDKVVRTPDDQRGYVVKSNEYPGHPADHYLLTSSAPISGIEDVAIRREDWTNYWPIAWSEAERVLPPFFAKRGITVDRTRIALAINSTMKRSQDILHIHLSCLRSAVRQALDARAGTISPQAWSDYLELQRVLGESGLYRVRRLRSLSEMNLFKIPFPDGEGEVRNQSLAVVAAGRTEQDGYFVLASYYDKDHPDRGHAEDIQDHDCKP